VRTDLDEPFPMLTGPVRLGSGSVDDVLVVSKATLEMRQVECVGRFECWTNPSVSAARTVGQAIALRTLGNGC
jgi:hypothetical protein